jgi:hypothetical protein
LRALELGRAAVMLLKESDGLSQQADHAKIVVCRELTELLAISIVAAKVQPSEVSIPAALRHGDNVPIGMPLHP